MKLSRPQQLEKIAAIVGYKEIFFPQDEGTSFIIS